MTPISRYRLFQVIFAKVDAVEQDLPFGRIVKPGEQLDDGGLALAVFADKRDPLAGMQVEIEPVENIARSAGIAERDVAEFEAPPDRPRNGQGRSAWSESSAASRGTQPGR